MKLLSTDNYNGSVGDETELEKCPMNHRVTEGDVVI